MPGVEFGDYIWNEDWRVEMEPQDEKKLAAKVGRDSDYRIAALNNAVSRASQDGGIEGTIDVLVLAETYYGWLLGSETTERPTIEKMLKGENGD